MNELKQGQLVLYISKNVYTGNMKLRTGIFQSYNYCRKFLHVKWHPAYENDKTYGLACIENVYALNL